MTVAFSMTADRRSPGWHFWLPLALLLLAIKLVLYWLDPDVMFFLGDSASYLHTATTGWTPSDRSWVYGRLLRRVTLGATQLELLVLFQVLVSVLSSLVLAVILRRFLACSLPLVALAAVANAFEPIQLLYERYVMAESVSLLAFGLFLIAVLSYLRRGQWWWLVVMALMAVSAGALRSAYLPVTMAVGLLAIGYYCSVCLLSRSSAAAGWRRPLWRRLGRAAAHVLILVLVWSSLSWLEGRNRPYTDKGFFLLSAWGPVLAQPGYPHDALMTELIQGLPGDCALEQLAARDPNLWFPECLSGRIKAHFATGAEASNYARGVALGALKNDPLGVLGLGYQTWATLWDDYSLRQTLYFDRTGSPTPSASFSQQLHRDWGLDLDDWYYRETLTNQYFFAATGWYRWVILAPLLMPLWWLLTLGRLNPASLMISVSAVLLLLVVTIPVTVSSVRFYHGIAWLTVLVSASSLDQLAAVWRACRRGKD